MGSGITKNTIAKISPPTKSKKLEPRIDPFTPPKITVVLSTNQNVQHQIPRPMSLQGIII